MSQRKTHLNMSDRVFYFFNSLLGLFFFLITAYPLIFVLSASVSDPAAVSSGKVLLWPIGFNLDGYRAVFASKSIGTGYINSLVYMIAGTSVNVVTAVLAAYPLSRKDFYGRNFFMIVLMFTTMFGGGLIPTYLLINSLGLINNRAVMIIPSAFSVWNAIMVMNYFRNNIPHEILEAAKMDGCNDFRFVWKIVVPLSAPILAVIALFSAVGFWNSYFNAMIYLYDSSKFPLQLVLRDVLINNQFSIGMESNISQLIRNKNAYELLKYSTIVVACLPLMLIYPIVQKHFVKGVMIGSLKG